MSKKVAVLIKDQDRQYEGLRVSLGLLLEDHEIDMFVLDHSIQETEEFLDNMSFIDEMGGRRYSNETENVSKHGFEAVSAEQLPALLPDYEIIIPF